MGDAERRRLERLVASGQAGETTQARLVKQELREGTEKKEKVVLEALLGDKVARKVLGEESPEISEDFEEWLVNIEALCDKNLKNRLMMALVKLILEKHGGQLWRMEMDKEFVEKVEEFIVSPNNEKLKEEILNLESELFGPEENPLTLDTSGIALSSLSSVLEDSDGEDFEMNHSSKSYHLGIMLKRWQEEAREVIQSELLPVVKGTGDPLAKRVEDRIKNIKLKESLDVIRDEEL